MATESQESTLQVVVCSVQSDAHQADNVLTPHMYRACQVIRVWNSQEAFDAPETGQRPSRPMTGAGLGPQTGP